jgi:O-antigen ligase
LTIWQYDKTAGLIAGLVFFVTKSFWVRLAFAIDGGLSGKADLLGITPALALATLTIWQMFIDFRGGVRLCPDRTRKLLTAFSALAFFSILISGSPLVGLAGFERNVLPNMIILFLVASLVTGRAKFEQLTRALILLGLISSAYAIGQYFMGLYPWEIGWFRELAFGDGLNGWLTIGLRGIEFRPFSVFYGYMDFFFTNVLIFALAVTHRKLWVGAWKIIYRLYLASWLIILGISLERMPLVMTLIIILTIKFNNSSHSARRKIAFRAALAGGLIYLILLIAGPYLKISGADKLIRMAELANPFQASSILDRTETKWLPALESIRTHPQGVGIGYGSQTRANQSASESDAYVQPHNEIIQKTLETGLIGGVIYLLLLVSVFKDSLILARSAEFKAIGLALMAGTVSFWVCGMVNLPFSGSSGLIYWALAGAALGAKDRAFQFETSAKADIGCADTLCG